MTNEVEELKKLKLGNSEDVTYSYNSGEIIELNAFAIGDQLISKTNKKIYAIEDIRESRTELGGYIYEYQFENYYGEWHSYIDIVRDYDIYTDDYQVYDVGDILQHKKNKSLFEITDVKTDYLTSNPMQYRYHYQLLNGEYITQEKVLEQYNYYGREHKRP